jgi:hypothetical protein
MKSPLAMEAPSMSLFSLSKTSIVLKKFNYFNTFVTFCFLHAHFVDSDVVAFGLVFNNILKISNPDFHTKLGQCIFWSNIHSIVTTFFNNL